MGVDVGAESCCRAPNNVPCAASRYEFTDVHVTGAAKLSIARPSSTSRAVMLIHNMYGDATGWLTVLPHTDFMLNGVVNGSRQREPTVVAMAFNDSFARTVRRDEVYLPTSFRMEQINLDVRASAKVVFPRVLHVVGTTMQVAGELAGVDSLILDEDAVVTFYDTSQTYVLRLVPVEGVTPLA